MVRGRWLVVLGGIVIAASGAACSGAAAPDFGASNDAGAADDGPGQTGQDATVDAGGGAADGASRADAAGGADGGAGADGGIAADASSDAGTVADVAIDTYVPPANTLKLTGTTLDAESQGPVASAVVSGAGAQTTSGATGAFTLHVPPATAFSMTATATGHAKGIAQELSISADADYGAFLLVAASTENLLSGLIQGLDTTKGAIGVEVLAAATCASVDKSTLSITPQSGSLIYFDKSGLPAKNQTSVMAGANPSALFYNLSPGTYVVSVSSPSCTQAAWPHAEGAITFTGNVVVENAAVSEARVFLR